MPLLSSGTKPHKFHVYNRKVADVVEASKGARFLVDSVNPELVRILKAQDQQRLGRHADSTRERIEAILR